MKLGIFSVYDEKAEAYLQPFFALTKGSALRAFADAVNDPKHEFARHAADYTLFQIGFFDQETGFVESERPVPLGNAVEFREVEEELSLEDRMVKHAEG